jgi:hypothetical protein
VGLYLCIFSSDDFDEEIDGVEVGSYDDFDALRRAVAAYLEGSRWGSRFPLLMMHGDSDGEWQAGECPPLESEFRAIQAEFQNLPPVAFAPGTWQHGIANTLGLVPRSLAESFIDVDGEPLLERMADLAALAAQHSRPISFQ